MATLQSLPVTAEPDHRSLAQSDPDARPSQGQPQTVERESADKERQDDRADATDTDDEA